MQATSKEATALGIALLPRARRGSRRVALVQEGGGMRGAFGAGVQAGFAEAGLPFDAFDALYGSSAGALNLMYWVSRRPGIGTGVYLEDLVRPNGHAFFLHRSPLDLLSRLARGLPGIDVGAVGHAMSETRPIDLEAVKASAAPIRVPVTRATDLATNMLDVRALPAEEILPVLLAGASVPVLTDHVTRGDAPIFDGAFVAPLPVEQALADGCTDLVVILTLPRWRNPPAYEEWILRLLARRRGVAPEVAKCVRVGRHARKAALLTLRRPPAGVNVTVIAPEILLARSLEQRPGWIRRIVDAGCAAGRSAIELARAEIATS
jgi:predicted patatin/cPLA2 family phospholipase